MRENNDILGKKRWLILAVSCLINICIGSVYAWSSLSAPMASELGVTDLSVVFSVTNSLGFSVMIIGGILNDRYGPRWLVFTGGAVLGVGMFLSGFANSVFFLVLSYGLCVGLGSSLVYGCIIGNTIKFFPDRKGMAGGMTTASYGISSVIFAPLTEFLSNAFGCRNTFRILGIIFLLLICIGSYFIRKCPDDYLPAGYHLLSQKRVTGQNNKTPLEMLQTPLFYIMLLLMTCGGIIGMMIISNARGIAVNMVGISGMLASLLVSLLCLFNTAGRLIAGILSDKMGRIKTLTCALVLALAGVMILLKASYCRSIYALVAGYILVGSCFGTFMGVFPGFCTDQFGTKYNTVNYGIMWIGFCLAGMFGPMILSKTYEKTSNYTNAFLIAILIGILGIVLSGVCQKIMKKETMLK